MALQVVGLDVGDHRDLRPQQQERAVALVGLDQEPLAAAGLPVVPGPARFAPIAKDGSSPAASAAVMSSEVVVVLPWVPAIATQRRPAIIAASAVARRSTRNPRSRPATSSAFAGSIAVV